LRLLPSTFGRLSRALLAAALLAPAGMPVADMLHALQHVREQRDLAGQQQSQAKPVCELCAAFTSIGHALPASRPPAAQASSLEAAVAPLPPGTVALRVRAYLERAPPPSLTSA